MANRPSRINMAVYSASADGRFYPRYATGNAPVSGGGGINGDPFSGYTQMFVDPLNGNDANPGTSQLNAKKTFAAGLALGTQGGTCVNFLSTAPMLVPGGTTLSLPAASGTGPNAQVVMRGLPSAGALPQIVFGLNSQLYVNQGGTRDYVTLRKLDISAQSTQSNPSSGAVSLVVWLSNAVCANPLVQYCNIHDSVSTDITAGIRIEGAHPNAEFSYNKIRNHNNTANSVNGAGVITYQTRLNLHHNDVSACVTGFYLKRCPPGTANNGPIISKNFLHDCLAGGNAIFMAEQGAGDTGAFFDGQITGNLFAGNPSGIALDTRENTLQSSRILVANNTWAPDSGVCYGFTGMTQISAHSNILMATSEKIELDYPGAPNGYINSFVLCDYNAYLFGVGDQIWMDRFGPTSLEFTTFADFKVAKSVHNRAEFAVDPEQHGTSFTNVAQNFPNYASRDLTLSPTSVLKGTGMGGIDPGYNSSDFGPGY